MENRIVRADLHNHLRTSGHITEKDLIRAIDAALWKLGTGGIFDVINFNSGGEIEPRWKNFVNGLTYDTIKTGNGRYVPEEDILVLHGQEVPTAEGYHVLAIGTLENEYVPNNLSMDKVLDEIKNMGALSVAAHPHHAHGAGSFLLHNAQICQKLWGFESFNGEASFEFFGRYAGANETSLLNFLTLRQVYNRNLISVFSSDGHSIYEIGRNWNEIEMPCNYWQFRDSPEKVISAIDNGYRAAMKKGLNVKKSPMIGRIGAVEHAFDLAVLIAGSKLGFEPNKRTAPFLQWFGFSV